MGDAEEARRIGMAATIFHWGLHPWAIYAIVGLSSGAVHLQQGPAAQRSARCSTRSSASGSGAGLGHVIDTLAVFATLFGLATSLGIGAEQANAGLEFLFGVPVNDVSKVVLIIGDHRDRAGLGGLGHGCRRQAAFRDQHDSRRAAVAVRHRYRPDGRDRHRLLRQSVAYLGCLPTLSNPFGRADDHFLPGLDGVLLGLVDLLVAVRRDVHRARQPKGRTVREFILPACC